MRKEGPRPAGIVQRSCKDGGADRASMQNRNQQEEEKAPLDEEELPAFDLHHVSPVNVRLHHV